VIEALKDLLVDKDNNVRTVAAISLARTGANDDKVINLLIKCLDERDRLVRESACLALGHLRSAKAVPKLVHLW
jgi:HEAT repeat protein